MRKSYSKKWLEPLKNWQSSQELIDLGEDMLSQELARRKSLNSPTIKEALLLEEKLEEELGRALPMTLIDERVWWWLAGRTDIPEAVWYKFLADEGLSIGGATGVLIGRIKQGEGDLRTRRSLERFLSETLPGKPRSNALTSQTYRVGLEEGWLELDSAQHQWLVQQIEDHQLGINELVTCVNLLLGDKKTTAAEIKGLIPLIVNNSDYAYLIRGVLRHPNCDRVVMDYICQQTWDGAVVGWLVEIPNITDANLESLVATEAKRVKPVWTIWSILAKRPESKWREIGVKKLALYFPNILKGLCIENTTILKGLAPSVLGPILEHPERATREWGIAQIGQMGEARPQRRART